MPFPRMQAALNINIDRIKHNHDVITHHTHRLLQAHILLALPRRD